MIELLVSLLLLSIVLVLVYGGFGQISEGARQMTADLTEGQEMRLLLRMIQDDLQSAQWLPQYWEKGVGYATGINADTTFENGKNYSDLSLHTAIATRFFREVPPEEDPGIHEVGYKVIKAEESEELLLVRREDFYIDNDLNDGGRTIVLVEDIEDFLVEFLAPGVGQVGLEEPWQNRWDSGTQPETARMPQAIRVTLSRKDETGKLHRVILEVNLGGALNP